MDRVDQERVLGWIVAAFLFGAIAGFVGGLTLGVLGMH